MRFSQLLKSAMKGCLMENSSQKRLMCEGFGLQQAIIEANRCLLCHDAPCSQGCPGGTDPGLFIRKLRLRNITGAIRTIKTNNILGGICGALCPVTRLCEEKCTATEIDSPIQIGKIQRALVEHSWDLDFEICSVEDKNGKKVAVVGSGPGGLSCAGELAKLGYEVTIFEAAPEPGGVLRYGVPEHRMSSDFLKKELEFIDELHIELKCNTSIDNKSGQVEKLLEEFDAVFFATGLWEPMDLFSENPEGNFSATTFLTSMRDGSDGHLKSKFAGKSIAVIGGGSVAMDCIESAWELGASDVSLIYRRGFNQMPAEKEEITEVLELGTDLYTLNQPISMEIENNKVKGLKLLRTKLGKIDESGRKSCSSVAGTEWILACDVVIEAIGSKASQTELYPGLDRNKKNLIKTDESTCTTNIKGVFAGGDIVRGPALIIEAVQDGKSAAIAIDEYVRSL
jgi:NADPH-dependent glutamate synthase beta subunit-like oxidoreductase